MRISLYYLGVAAFITGFGCQQQSDIRSNSKPATVLSRVTDSEPTNPPEKIKPQSITTSDQEHSEAEDHTHGGRGMMTDGPGRMGRGPGAIGGMREDMTTLHSLFDGRNKIKRTIKNLPNGAETLTESDDDEIAGLLQEHVPAMEGRVSSNDPLPPMTFQPLFKELIKHADNVAFEYDETERGIKVTYTSNDPYVILVIQEHAKLVSRFIKNGMEEIHKPYTLPRFEGQSEKLELPEAPPSDEAK